MTKKKVSSVEIPIQRLLSCALPEPILPMKFGNLTLDHPESLIRFKSRILPRLGCGLIGIVAIALGSILIWMAISGAKTDMHGKALILLLVGGSVGVMIAISQCGLTINTKDKRLTIYSYLGLRKQEYDSTQLQSTIVDLDQMPVQGATIALRRAEGKTIRLDPRTRLSEPTSHHVLLLAVIISTSFGINLTITGKPINPSKAFRETYGVLYEASQSTEKC